MLRRTPLVTRRFVHLMKRKLDTATSDGRPTPGMGSIILNPREKQFKALLLDVARGIPAKPEPVALRWAGGWVRDKLLGTESHDIDVAISCMTGEAFTRELVAFCNDAANRDRHGISEGDIGNLHKVAANPDKSKHLETVTTRMFGLEVDFVNLRKETYTEDSRNPQMEFGTAEEDALRRDATVNALFYNIHTSEVEDFVGGLRDMDQKLIRTPLEPLQTFKDDPLRVLRLVRFASRLGFTIDPSAEKTMSAPDVLEALRLKISRERVGVEVEKMLKGKHPRDSLHLIDRLQLYQAIFTDPSRTNLPSPDLSRWSTAYECMNHLTTNTTPGSIYHVLVRTEEEAYFCWILTAILPWEVLELPEEKIKGSQTLPIATLAAREGIRASNKLCDIVTATHRNRKEIQMLKKAVCDNEPYVKERDRMGMAVRRWDTRVGNWRPQVLAAALAEVMTCAEPGSVKSRDEVLSGWQKFLDHLEELDVLDAPALKKIIDGKTLSKALGVKPGPWMTSALDVCVAWQLRNPGVTDTTEAVEEVRQRAKELGITLSK
ncbi:hypothetical protein MCOR27_006708 [Pyricularia oryzae]|uniref:tRNA nucleotidyltransferase n=3 Tax=Pyricularia TaxID=48558 RepID=A0ABQ8NC00_PYRGI|nr:poly(A) polymerase [Pyricularia oryzae 70-15]KAH8839671.1 hypothetical protein MCOR01_008858 [Pyricularia oryzae]KAI6294639.1 hypothetical protein MCOR33_008303 [Pyricularia grisea]EHA55473.1 poly(A) polymerase [Pyricularia oryzae 70-15]KAH9439531.1 hypothetical protein MCOR02_003081 [Pyricularia oryzae]KAI6255396.1 hypothetical protein MCOR19_008098 [Pyricularia oryzae]